MIHDAQHDGPEWRGGLSQGVGSSLEKGEGTMTMTTTIENPPRNHSVLEDVWEPELRLFPRRESWKPHLAVA